MWKLLEPRSTAASTSGTDFGARRVKDQASGGEGRAATASGLRVRIANHELGAVETFAIVDFRAGKVLDAHRIDEQLDAQVLDAGVSVLLLFVELEAVLHTRATAALHENAQLEVRIPFAANQVTDLPGSGIGEFEGFGFDFSHGLHTTRRILPPQPPRRPRAWIPRNHRPTPCQAARVFPL